MLTMATEDSPGLDSSQVLIGKKAKMVKTGGMDLKKPKQILTMRSSMV